MVAVTRPTLGLVHGHIYLCISMGLSSPTYVSADDVRAKHIHRLGQMDRCDAGAVTTLSKANSRSISALVILSFVPLNTYENSDRYPFVARTITKDLHVVEYRVSKKHTKRQLEIEENVRRWQSLFEGNCFSISRVPSWPSMWIQHYNGNYEVGLVVLTRLSLFPQQSASLLLLY